MSSDSGTVAGLVAEIGHAIREEADPQMAQKVARAVPGAKTLGVTVPQLRTLVKTFRAKHRDLSLEQATNLMDAFCGGRCREEVLFGIFLLAGYGKRVRGLEWRRIGAWIEAIDNWEVCDQLATNVSGPVVARQLECVEYLVELARSRNQWKRRLAVATVSELNHKGMQHADETFRICRLLLDDPEPTVWKAVGWAIREVSKKDEAAAYEFLRSNRKRMSRQLLREASEKLSQQNKQSLKDSND